MSILNIIKEHIGNLFRGIEEKYGGLNRELDEEEAQKIRGSISNTHTVFKCTSEKIKSPILIQNKPNRNPITGLRIPKKQSKISQPRKLNLDFYPIYESPKSKTVMKQDSCQLKYR